MKPPPFRLESPHTLPEALDLLAEHGDDAKVIAGGQSLMPLLALRLARPEIVVDITRLPALRHLDAAPSMLRIGGLVTHRAVERSEVPATVRAAVRHIGHVAIRNRGTVGGSLAHGDPSAEWAAIALAFDGEIEARRRGESRTIAAEDFFLGFLTTALAPDELVCEMRLQLPAGRYGSAFVEYARRHGDFAVAGVCVVLQVDSSDTVAHARVAVIGAAPAPVRCHRAEQALVGRRPSAATINEAGRLVPGELGGVGADDERAYRVHAATTLASRALALAARDAVRDD
jgi:aerobic carbon-monoxide dehydrogenase medium subunit